jgi:hypothetical protein
MDVRIGKHIDSLVDGWMEGIGWLDELGWNGLGGMDGWMDGWMNWVGLGGWMDGIGWMD